MSCPVERAFGDTVATPRGLRVIDARLVGPLFARGNLIVSFVIGEQA
jgi:hypothetical protein